MSKEANLWGPVAVTPSRLGGRCDTDEVMSFLLTLLAGIAANEPDTGPVPSAFTAETLNM